MPIPATASPAAFPQGFPMPGLTAADLPLQGMTILAVEDSRFASEALRLLCRRAGARLRRAETLAQARAHLRVYRPDVVIVDLGLPDGSGGSLIRDLVLAQPRPAVVLGASGDAQGRACALAAGADGFLDKPVPSLAVFCTTLLAHLPDPGQIGANQTGANQTGAALIPDPLALHDDLTHAADLLAQNPDAPARQYLSGFLHGLARLCQDAPLAAAAGALSFGTPAALDTVRRLIDRRLSDAALPAGPVF